MENLLFFASDFKIGLSSLLTDELLALSKCPNLRITAVAGEKEQEKGLYDKLSRCNLSVVRINKLDDHLKFRDSAFRIKDIIKENNIKYIHVQNNWQLAIVAFAKYLLLRDRHLKIIYTLHGFRHNSPIKSVIAQIIIGTALLLFSDRVICMSTYLLKKFSLLKYKVSLIPLGISDDYFFNQHPILPSKGLQLIFPAQFRFGKNQDLIIRAFAKHIEGSNDTVSHLVFPGCGPLENELKNLVASLNIAERVSFPGFCTKEKIRNLYLQSNIGIVASNSETFGQSIVEPFVLGRCVISTHVGIAEDVLKEGVNGFFFKTESQLTKIFDDLYSHQNLIYETGSNNFGQRHIFLWKTVMTKYVDMIASMK